MRSRYFDGASEWNLAFNGTIQSNYPTTMACWYKLGAAPSAIMTLMNLGRPGADTNYGELGISATGAVIGVNTISTRRTATSTAGTTSTSTWNHAACVLTSATSRAAFFNGANKGTNTTSVSISGSPTYFSVGAASFTTTPLLRKFNGYIALPVIWNAALTDDEIAALGAGVNPLQIRPWAISDAWLHVGWLTNDQSYASTAPSILTVTGATGSTDFPEKVLWLPRRRIISVPSVSAQDVTGIAFANTQAFGTARLDLGLLLSAHVNAQTFGTAQLVVDRRIDGIAFTNPQSFGTAALVVDRRIDTTGFQNVQLYGTARLDLNIAPTALANAQTYGTAVVSLGGGAQTITLASFANVQLYGTPRLDLNIAGAGFQNVQAYGTAQVLKLDQWLEPVPIVGVQAFGTATVNRTIAPAGFANVTSYGTALVRVDPRILAAGLTVTHSYGTPVVTGGAAPTASPGQSQIRVVQAKISVR